MKKIFALLLAAALCLGLAACAAKDAPADVGEPAPASGTSAESAEPAPVSQPLQVEEPEPETIWTGPEGVTVSPLQTVYPEGVKKLTLIVDNSTDLMLGYGEDFSLQKYTDGVWQKIAFQENTIFYDDLYLVLPHSARVMPYSTVMLTRALDEGLYRLTGSEFRMWEEWEPRESRETFPAWHVDFRVTADAQPEPDYALYISAQPIPTVDGCLVTDRLPVYFINNTGEDGNVLDIPHLERRNDAGEWEEVPYKDNVGFCGTPSRLPAEGREWSEEISMLWGTLEDGTYRLSYAVGPTFETEETVSGEFTLYTPENNQACRWRKIPKQKNKRVKPASPGMGTRVSAVRSTHLPQGA